jgi:hypothetical protein
MDMTIRATLLGAAAAAAALFAQPVQAATFQLHPIVSEVGQSAKIVDVVRRGGRWGGGGHWRGRWGGGHWRGHWGGGGRYWRRGWYGGRYWRRGWGGGWGPAFYGGFYGGYPGYYGGSGCPYGYRWSYRWGCVPYYRYGYGPVVTFGFGGWGW